MADETGGKAWCQAFLLECAGNQCQGDNHCGEMDCDVCGMTNYLGRDSYFWLRCQACGYMVYTMNVLKRKTPPVLIRRLTPTGKCDIERPGFSICSQNNDNEKCFGRFRGVVIKVLQRLRRHVVCMDAYKSAGAMSEESNATNKKWSLRKI